MSTATALRSPARPKARVRSVRDRWLVAYADMITLLLACFASLYAATLEPNGAPKGPPAAARAEAHAAAGQPAPASAPSPAAPADAATVRLRAALAHIVREHGELSALDLTADERGLIISLPEAGSFPTGRAEPSEAAQAILMEVGSVLAPEPASIRVEGHTDDVPIRSAEFASNWELSTARATRVVQFLIERAGLPPERLSAAGYGEFRPRVSNDSPASRARNRRVDIVVLSAETAKAEEPPVRRPR